MREDAAAESDLAKAGYRDRLLTELAQNAADAAAAAAIMEPLLSNEAYRKNMGAEAKKRMQAKFSRTQFNEQIMACIEKQQ